MRHRFVILSMVLFVLFRPTSMFAQAGRALLQQSHRAQLGPGPLPSDVVLAGQIEDGRASPTDFKSCPRMPPAAVQTSFRCWIC